jgi:hypothetical protein
MSTRPLINSRGNARSNPLACPRIISYRIVLSPRTQRLYMTVHGIQQQLQSSVLMHEHLPGCGLTMEPAVDEMELEAGIL